jgi:hypothetical protein
MEQRRPAFGRLICAAIVLWASACAAQCPVVPSQCPSPVYDNVSIGGHLANVSASVPVLSNCGTSPSLSAGSSDLAGRVNVGSSFGSLMTCTVTFGAAYSKVPTAVILTLYTSVGAYISSSTTTGFTIHTSSISLAGNTFAYLVIQ